MGVRVRGLEIYGLGIGFVAWGSGFGFRMRAALPSVTFKRSRCNCPKSLSTQTGSGLEFRVGWALERGYAEYKVPYYGTKYRCEEQGLYFSDMKNET